MLKAMLVFLCLWAASVSAAWHPFFSRCPEKCDILGDSPSNWTYYHDPNALNACNETVLFQFNVQIPVNDPNTHFAMRACQVSGASSPAVRLPEGPGAWYQHYNQTKSVERRSAIKIKRQLLSFNTTSGLNGTHFANSSSSSINASIVATSSCAANVQAVQQLANFELKFWDAHGSINSTQDSIKVLQELSNYLQRDTSCESANIFARSGKVIAGVFAGAQIHKPSTADVFKRLTDEVKSGRAASSLAIQYCPDKAINTQIFGVHISTSGSISAAQSGVKVFNDAQCNSTSDSAAMWPEVPLGIIPGHEVLVVPNTEARNGSSTSTPQANRLVKRDTCSYTQVQAGDGCWALANRCGITQPELEAYNPSPKFCNTLQVGKYVCCSAGSLPDFSPQPQADGSCTTYTIQTGDFCSEIANAHSMTAQQVEDRNKQTWGWMGCTRLVIGQVICLSTGSTPMPAPMSGAVCGPQVAGTPQPADMSTLANLNPCALNACCNIWGQCGITGDFCIYSPADTGAPGTAQPGTNGCVSNCGTDIVNNGAGPGQFMSLGYYEAFGMHRSCLHMLPSHINTNRYTHIHYAFGGLTSNYQVDMSAEQPIFNEFVRLQGVKKIISFGGWAFSNEGNTWPLFREGVRPQYRETFATNVVNFINDYGFDGVDFDWEYPGAPDIPGIPAGYPDDGVNYLAFLQRVRQLLPAGKTLSIAAPSSFWYLKNFPISEMAPLLDYIVYMTYDLHGQWDYGNPHSATGCPDGNCLRSHSNWTETMSALSMITKAGVPTNKILNGMALYGRSFEMTSPGCYGEMCTYTGPDSTATPGICTGTRGYISNWEIRQIAADAARNAQHYSDVHGDIMVYDNTQWVSYLRPETHANRRSTYQSLNMGGIVDWAVDLDDNFGSTAPNTGSGEVVVSPDIFMQPNPVIACYPPCTFIFPPWPLTDFSTVSVAPATLTLEQRWSYIATQNGVTFASTITDTVTTTVTIAPVVTKRVSIWAATWTDETQETIYLTSSLDVRPVTLTQAPTTVTINGIPTTLPGVTWTYDPGPNPLYTAPTGTITPMPPPPPPGLDLNGNGVHVVKGDPAVKCKPGQLCGTPCTKNCKPQIPCIGICGCIGPGCRLGGCIGPGCVSGGAGNNGEECTQSKTVTDCEVSCSVTTTPGALLYTTSCYSTSCTDAVVGCDQQGTTITTRTTVGCPTRPATTDWFTASDQALPLIGQMNGYAGQFDGTWTLDPQPTGIEPPDVRKGRSVVIMAEQWTTRTTNTVTSYFWTIFDAKDFTALCTTPHTFQIGAGSGMPGMPGPLGAFDIDGNTGCRYEDQTTQPEPDAVGMLVCENGGESSRISVNCYGFQIQQQSLTDIQCKPVPQENHILYRRVFCPY